MLSKVAVVVVAGVEWDVAVAVVAAEQAEEGVAWVDATTT